MKKDISKQDILIISIGINTTIFLLLSLLHFYWAFGGELWFEDVLPSNSSGSKRINPGKLKHAGGLRF